VSYGEVSGRLQVYARAFRSIRLLETVAEHVGDQFVWRAPIALEMQSCGTPGAHWDVAARTLTLCYEMADDFAQLYRDYAENQTPPLGTFPLRVPAFITLAGALAAGLVLGYGAGWRQRRAARTATNAASK